MGKAEVRFVWKRPSCTRGRSLTCPAALQPLRAKQASTAIKLAHWPSNSSPSRSTRLSPLLLPASPILGGTLRARSPSNSDFGEIEMAQAYGAAPTRDSGPERTGNYESEASTLLPPASPVGEAEVVKDGHASLGSCVGNLTNTIIGSGTTPCCSLRYRR